LVDNSSIILKDKIIVKLEVALLTFTHTTLLTNQLRQVFCFAADSKAHDFINRREEETTNRQSPVSSDSFDASERSFNPEQFEEDSSN
jgi:hypothetical protein